MQPDQALRSSHWGEQQGASLSDSGELVRGVAGFSDCGFIAIFSDEEVGTKTAAATGAAELPEAGPR